MITEKLQIGSKAASHLEPYQQRISKNFELPIHVGRLVAQWDDPEFTTASQASHMREPDYVVGLVHNDGAFAMPMWIADNYHVINCVIGGDPVVYTTCERCQSGSAFLSIVDGKPVKFSALGMYNASLTMTDRAGFLGQAGSLWLHYEGVCIDGPAIGSFLQQIPTFHMTWAEWIHLHPDSSVMLEPRDRHHRDARHGHGREEYFSRPGMDPPLVLTITGSLDDRYPENEFVLGVNADDLVKAYPLKEVKKSGSVVHDHAGDVPIVVFAGPRPEQVTMAAYVCVLDGKQLSFQLADTAFIDSETGSTWTIEGQAVQGPLSGKRLDPIRWECVRWHAWFYPHRSTALFRFQDKLPEYPNVLSCLDPDKFRPILDGLSQLKWPLCIEGVIPNLCLPHETAEGFTLRIGEDRLNLYRFTCSVAAEDYVGLDGAWFCFPISKKVGRKFSRRVGPFVIESDPEIQYADPSQFVRLPDPEIAWSTIITSIELEHVLPIESTGEPKAGTVSFIGLFDRLRNARFDVVEAAFLPHTQLRIDSINAVAATINGDRFAIYKCRSADLAGRVLQGLPHAFQIERLVFRSIPLIMYRDPCYEMGQLPENEIRWSALLSDKRFITTIERYCR